MPPSWQGDSWQASAAILSKALPSGDETDGGYLYNHLALCLFYIIQIRTFNQQLQKLMLCNPRIQITEIFPYHIWLPVEHPRIQELSTATSTPLFELLVSSSGHVSVVHIPMDLQPCGSNFFGTSPSRTVLDWSASLLIPIKCHGQGWKWLQSAQEG